MATDAYETRFFCQKRPIVPSGSSIPPICTKTLTAGLGTYFIVVVNAYREHLQWQQLQQQQRPESETEPLAK